MRRDVGRVLVIAGSDSGGGAGLQADIKTVTALGGYAATAVTAITVQNTLGVQDIFPLPPELVQAQCRAVLDDIGADVVKIGMLGSAELVDAVARVLDSYPDIPVVLDPVMTAKGGATLLADAALERLKAELAPRAAVLTPNAPEAEALTGLPVRTEADARRAGAALLRMGAKAVLMKGGHLTGDTVTDLLLSSAGELVLTGDRVQTRHTHGTGCTLASALATGMAQGLSVEQAALAAHAYVQGAIRHAPGFGAGHGPLDHGWRLRSAGPQGS